MYTATISSQRQVTLPKAVLDQMNLKAGDKLSLELTGQQIALHKVPDISELAGSLHQYAVRPVPTDETTDQAIMDYVGINYLVKNATARWH